MDLEKSSLTGYLHCIFEARKVTILCAKSGVEDEGKLVNF